MTAYAQVKRQIGDQLGLTLTVKSVNHRLLDVHLRLPPELDGLEVKLRRFLKERIARGHLEVTMLLERGGQQAFAFNRELVSAYVAAFRSAAREFGIAAEPDLNALLRLPGALTTPQDGAAPELESVLESALDEAIERLNRMREEEGRGTERELRNHMTRLEQATAEVEKMRTAVTRGYHEKLLTRIQELAGTAVDGDRLLQEAAIMAARSDVQEEIVRMNTHIRHFVGLLEQAGEAGKKLDFLLQEMNREANTLLSKAAGLSGEALRITEIGLAMKADIEKAREQVQNLE
jgi:uncharacterized protein (TIGR00255 family)